MSARLGPRQWSLVALGVAFFASRLFHLTILPAFRDESAHIFWSVHLFDEAAGIGRPMADGKLLQVLLMALVMPWASDPLWTGRLVSVLAGAVGMWSCRELGRRLYGEPVGLVAAVLYLVCPFALFHDRMALADVCLSSFAAASLVASLTLLERPSAASGARLGFAMGAAILSKIPGLMVLGVPPLAALLVGPRTSRPWRPMAIAYAVTLALVAVPAGYFFLHTTQLQAKGLAAAAPALTARVAENAGLAFWWLWAYWTPPILVAALAAALVGLFKRDRADMLLALCAIGPPAAFVLFAVSWFPRYILFATIPALVLAARLCCRVGRSAVRTALLVLLGSIPALRFDAALLGDPAHAPFPAVDRFQYVDGWPSGYGGVDAVALVRRELRASPSGVAVTTGKLGHGTVYFVLRTAFLNEPRVRLAEVDLWDPATHAEIGRSAAAGPTFLVTSWSNPARARPIPVSESFVAASVATLRKPDGTLFGEMFRAFPAGAGE